MPGRLPLGIPRPSFGYLFDSTAPATIYVDNTNPDCDDGKGTMAEPLCDLFRGGRSTSYEAGDVVHVLGGPYSISGDLTLRLDGREDAPVVIKGTGGGRILFDGGGTRVNLSWTGSHGILENLAFFHKTRHSVEGNHLAFRNFGVTNPVDAFIDFNPVVNLVGHDILLYESEIGNNRRTNDTDSHGIQAGSGSFNLWILDNDIYNNNGDAFQGCHQCFSAPPHHVYIGRNRLHDDRENGIDLKTIHDVVISENTLYGYGSSATSNGDAMVIGSNGFDESIGMGPKRIWVVNNELRDSSRGLRIEGSEDVWILGNVFADLNQAIQIDDKPHRLVVVASNTMARVAEGLGVLGCQPDELAITNNIIWVSTGRHLDLGECPVTVPTLSHNLFWSPAAALSVRVDGARYGDTAELDQQGFANGNLLADPAFEATTFFLSDPSPARNAGATLDSIYTQFQSTWGEVINQDRAGTLRPAEGAEDIGAYEHP